MINKQSVSKKSKTQSPVIKELVSQLDKEDQHIQANPDDKSQDSAAASQFKEFYNKSIAQNQLKAGDVVKGRIVGIDDDYVVVDVNYKSEGLIPKSEFQGAQGTVGMEIGSEVDVFVDNIENENGMVVLSKDRADIMRVWDDISQTAKNQKIIEGTVISKVKGGLHVDIGGVKAFLPGSQIELRPVKQLDQYVGKVYSFRIIKFNQKRGNIVLSRRVILQEERENLRSQTLVGIEKGAVVKGIVKNITDYGAFIDLGGIDGLLHIADISWSRIKHPSEKLSVGQSLEVKVLKFDKDKNRVSLGLKQLDESGNPWEQVKKNLNIGDKVSGKVTSLIDYGAFVVIKEGVEGLVHVSEMSWGKRIKHPSEKLNVDDELDLKIIGVDHDHQRISFSIKRLEPSPWEKWLDKYPKGAQVEVTVQSVSEFGLNVQFDEENLEGIIRLSDLSWSSRGGGGKSKYSPGDKINAVVLQFNEEEEKFQFGVKQLLKNPWDQIESLYPIGSVHQVKVVKIVDFGVFVELDQGIEGLIHISELSKNRVNQVEDVVQIGDVISSEIITMDKDSQKIGLSRKMVELREDSKSLEKKAVSGSQSEEDKNQKKESFFAKALRASISKSKLKQEQESSDSSAEEDSSKE